MFPPLESDQVRRLFELLASALFVFYCTTVGIYLVLRPWTGRPAIPGLGLFGSGFFRGFVSGLGLLHLAVGVSDLRVLSRALQGGRGPEDPEGRPE